MLRESPQYCQIVRYAGSLIALFTDLVHVLLPRELKSALKSMVGFLNTYEYFELLQFIYIIYITNKRNQ